MAIKRVRYDYTRPQGEWEIKETVGVGTTVALEVDVGVRIMSDVWADCRYAVCQTPEGAWERVYVGDSEFGGQPDAYTIDAPPALIAAYEAHKAAEVARKAAEAEARHQAALAYAAAKEAATPRRGRRVTVVKGRKVARGTTGEVIWYGAGNWGWRVGIKDAGGAVHWTAASNVEVCQ